MNIPEIDIRDSLLSRHRSVFATIGQIARKYPTDRWALVGGLMVLVVGREHGARAQRAEGTKDADIVIDIVAHPNMLGDLSHFLVNEAAYRLQDAMGNDPTRAARCSFITHSASIDVLCPDDTPAEQLVVPSQHVASIAIPGGRRALETGRLVSIYYSDDHPNADIHVPTLPGAIAVKAAAAVDRRTAGSPRHLQDVAFLLALDADLDDIKFAFTHHDVELLRSIAADVTDARSPMWRDANPAQRQIAQAAFDYLIR